MLAIYRELKNPRNRRDCAGFKGGACRVRTGDPLLAKQMRYQLRQCPAELSGQLRQAPSRESWNPTLDLARKKERLDGRLIFFCVGPGGLEPPTSSLSGMRSNHLSYGPEPRDLLNRTSG